MEKEFFHLRREAEEQRRSPGWILRATVSLSFHVYLRATETLLGDFLV